jgi:hypothetical protein
VEISCRFVIARSVSSKLIEFTEEVLDETASLVEVFIVRTWLFAVGLCRDNGIYSGFAQRRITRSSAS